MSRRSSSAGLSRWYSCRLRVWAGPSASCRAATLSHGRHRLRRSSALNSITREKSKLKECCSGGGRLGMRLWIRRLRTHTDNLASCRIRSQLLGLM